MRLSRVNVIDEGLVLIESVFLISGIMGQWVWHVQVLGYELNQLLIVGGGVINVIQCLEFMRQATMEVGVSRVIRSLGLPASAIVVFVMTQ